MTTIIIIITIIDEMIIRQPAGVRLTTQRRAILSELCKVRSHPTADELYEAVRKRLPHISLGTVYRNLELLCAAGAVRKLEVGGAAKRFDADLSPHYHVRCVACSRVDDVSCEPLAGVEERCAELTGYEVLTHHIEFSGFCRSCSAARKQEA